MAQELLSSVWYRVAELRPRLRSHVRVSRHEYRGERWYVVADRLSRRAHRVNPAAHFVIGLLNGRRRMQEVWDAVVERFGARGAHEVASAVAARRRVYTNPGNAAEMAQA